MKLKQNNIKETLGVSNALISMILSGKRSISYRMAKKINAITGKEITWIMEASPEKLRDVFKLLEGNTPG